MSFELAAERIQACCLLCGLLPVNSSIRLENGRTQRRLCRQISFCRL